MELNSLKRQLVLLAPAPEDVPDSLKNRTFDYERHEVMLAKAQKLRGRIYLEDGAIEPRQLTSDGRYCVEGDERSWHLLAVDNRGDVCGCARYHSHTRRISFSRLGVRGAAESQPEMWNQKLRWAIESDLQLARKRRFAFVEVGGWALREDVRKSTEAIRIALGAYALARHLGGCLGVTTATVRHRSSAILGRIGGRTLQAAGAELETYYDPRYKCEMTILGFDSTQPNPRYEPWIAQIHTQMRRASVISRTSQCSSGKIAAGGRIHDYALGGS